MAHAKGAMTGVKVLDFTWAGVGPMTTRYLSEHGATVVRIESLSRLDAVRTHPPYIGGQAQINRSHSCSEVNVNKQALGLNLSLPRARDLVRSLIAAWQPDIITENFTPGVMKRWGLDYEAVRLLKPDIIYFSCCQAGQYGPRAGFAGYGHLAAAIAGYFQITGYADREPSPPHGGVSDWMNPPLGVAALIASLDYRRRTGLGQYIDQAQSEVPIHYFAPMVLDYTVNERVFLRRANRDDRYTPHSAFPCRGDDRWIAIAVTSDDEWQALKGAMGNPAWAEDLRFATFASRKANEDELEERIGQWTQGWEVKDLFIWLQQAGVPAGIAQSAADLQEDPQLAHYHAFRLLEHPEGGPMPHMAPRFRLSRTPGELVHCYAKIGAENEKVLKEFAGLNDEDIADLAAEGVIEWS